MLGVGVPKVMSAFRIITGAYLRGRELVLFLIWGSRYIIGMTAPTHAACKRLSNGTDI